jgi:hypothetical protein
LTTSSIDPATGNLLVGGKPVFPLGLSDPPPLGSTEPDSGLDAWTEIARAGASFVRNYTVWTAAGLDEQLIAAGKELDAAPAYGLQVWLALAGVDEDLTRQSLLDRIVNAFKAHPGLGAWKGADEPALGRVPAAGCVAVYRHLRALDPNHPLVIVEAPRAPGPTPQSPTRPLTPAAIRPYAAACDVHAVDVYPVSIPAGLHAGGPPVNTDISVVGDMTRIVARASSGKAIWTTLQIAWSGVIPPHPVVFPTLQQARFMAYDAVVAGARGLFFFGGHLTQVMDARDRQAGWNWTYWRNVQRPLLVELADDDHRAALTAPLASGGVETSAADIALSARETGGFLYLIAVRRSPTATGTVRFSGLPAGMRSGVVLPHPEGNPARPVTVTGGVFTDPSPYAPHNARVYRLPRGSTA